MTNSKISDHYRQVATQSRRAQTKDFCANTENAVDVANEADAAGQMFCANGCCDDILSGSEATHLYPKEVLANIPAQSLAASRGCGDPVAQAQLHEGERVLDLGSGGGIDALIAARLVGPKGFVFGLDMVPEMVSLARESAQVAGIENVEFIEGDIEEIPLADASVDVVISNCVINLCLDKQAVFSEAFRVLRPEGRVVVSDIVAFEPIPSAALDALCTVTGCRGGIPQKSDYEAMLAACGFSRIELETKTLYTAAVLEEKARRKHHEDCLEALAKNKTDGICGSVIVRAQRD